jgi:hypothetical protein
MQAVASRDVLVDQVGGGQPGQGLAGVAGAGPDQGRGRRHGEMRPRHQAEQAEELALGSGQALVGRAERGPDGGVGVALDLQRGQPVPDPERGHLAGDGLLGVVGQVGRGDPQRQRQMRAGPGQLGRGLGFGLDAPGADDLAEQRLGLLRLQRAQDQPPGPVGGDQPGQAVAAGDHDQAAGAAGQQRPDLVGGGRVVEQQQQPTPGRHRPVQASRLLQVGRDLVHAEPVQQLAQRLDRAQLRGRRIAA